MKKRALNFIVCPNCKSDFQLKILSEENGRIKEGLITCYSCKEIYPIINFIPRIIRQAINDYPDFLEKYNLSLEQNIISNEPLSGTEELNLKTKESFGYQWTREMYSQIISRFEDDFLTYVYPINKDFFHGKIGLDLGCGFGRHIYYAAKLGAEMVGIDFSRAIDSAYNNTKMLPNVFLIQADIYNLPLKSNYFDFVYSIGVLHHLPDPERGFKAILPLLKPKGYVLIWVYSKSRPIVNFAIESVRLVTKRIPHKVLYLICIILSCIEWLFIIIPYKILQKLPIIRGFLEKIIFGRIKIYSKYPFDVLCADWFDRLSAPIRHYYNAMELNDWFIKANLNIIKISPTGGYGWRAFGQKL